MDQRNQEFRRRLLATFKIEAGEHVQALSSGLIELEKATNPKQRAEILEIVFREAHSLKGAARAVDCPEIESICQRIESVFAGLKRTDSAIAPGLLDVLHDALDTLGKLLSSMGLAAPDKVKPPISELQRRLDRAVAGADASISDRGRSEKVVAPVDPVRDLPRALFEDKPVRADTVRIATAKLDALLFQAEGLLAAKLTAAQRALEIRDAIAALGELKKERDRITSSAKADRQGSGKNGDGFAEPQLRRMLELAAWENTFLRSFETRLGALASAAERDHRTLAGMVDGLLEDVKEALMLPVSTALEVLPKSVRDLSRAQGKEAELAVRGGEIEIDRRILEQMRDPLIHLVRNCIDHGIETPGQRKLKSKPSRGIISVAISQKDGSRIEILVSDDGAGIDAARVEAAARKLGIVPEEHADGAEQPGVLPLVFHSGVTTSPIITELSGRGLGLAIVREKVETLGGMISVESEPGKGTTFRMELPLTLAIYRGVHVKVNDQLFVLPTIQVEHAVRIPRSAVKTVENRETIPWNGQVLALVRLADVLELPGRNSDYAAAGTIQVMILGSGNKRIALQVDEIIGEQEILVKPLGRQLSRVRNIAGATVLGTGKAVPILNVADLLRSAVGAVSTAAAALPGKPSAAGRKSILVAEASITSRALLKNILESAGYEVSTAVDGIDAFSRLKTQPFDLLVSDVEMPRMSGFELTARIRSDKALAELPVVLVTALESQEHRERGIDVGADAYIVKSSFDQGNLLEVVRRLA